MAQPTCLRPLAAIPCALALLISCRERQRVPPPTPKAAVAPVTSNTRHTDYVGPEVCSACHQERYEQWSENLHRKMNRLVEEPRAVLGDFSTRIRYGPFRVSFTRQTGSPYMTIEKGDRLVRRYRVTRTIGSRYLQEYVGVVEAPEGSPEDEVRLPFGYAIRSQEWLHQQYFDSWYGEEYRGAELTIGDNLTDEAPWKGRCAWCHNTYAFEERLWRLAGDEQRGNGLEQFFVSTRPVPEEVAARLEENYVGPLVTVGISCESCHLGGREHAVEGKPIQFAPYGPDISPKNGAPALSGRRSDPVNLVAICAQCHSAPTDLHLDGAGQRNSSEALDLLSGHCAPKITCTQCHDPHLPGPGAGAKTSAKHVAACLSCHPKYSEEELRAEHSLHGKEVTCLDCHMPKIVQGVDAPIRSHRISTPGDPRMIEGSVNACNLCHLRESLGWTVDTLRTLYGMDIQIESRNRPAYSEWLSSKERIVRLTAAEAMGASGDMSFAVPLAELLDAPVAYDRWRYRLALERLLKRRLTLAEFEVMGTPEVRSRQRRALLEGLSEGGR